jgi:hypothetical protein
MRIEIRKDVIRKFNMVIFVLFMVISVTMGIMGYRIGIKKETERAIENVYADNGMDDLINKKSTEYETFIYYDDMERRNGDYYVKTSNYSEHKFSEDYVNYKKSMGIEGEMVMVNQSLYDINK